MTKKTRQIKKGRLKYTKKKSQKKRKIRTIIEEYVRITRIHAHNERTERKILRLTTDVTQ